MYVDIGSAVVLGKSKKEIIIIKCFKIYWFYFVQGKSCWMWLELYALFDYLHVQTEHIWLMLFGYFMNVQILKLRRCMGHSES
jgi:hypothetical protein